MRDLHPVAALPPPLLKIMEPLLHATRNRLALILRLNLLLPVLITLRRLRPLPALHNRARIRGMFNGMEMLLGTNIFMPPDPLVALLLNAPIRSNSSRAALNAPVATIPRAALNAVTIIIITTLKVAPNAQAIRITLLPIALEALLVRRIQTIAVPLALLPIAPALLRLRANALNVPLIPANALIRAAIPSLRRVAPVPNALAIAPAVPVALIAPVSPAARDALPTLALALIASARLNAKLRWSRRSLPALSRSHLRLLSRISRISSR
jgi:hypothetical protein